MRELSPEEVAAMWPRQIALSNVRSSVTRGAEEINTMLTKGDTIKTTKADGTEITVTIDDIYIDPEFDHVLVYIYHSVKPKERTSISFDNLKQWFKEAEWEKVEP